MIGVKKIPVGLLDMNASKTAYRAGKKLKVIPAKTYRDEDVSYIAFRLAIIRRCTTGHGSGAEPKAESTVFLMFIFPSKKLAG